MVKYPNIIVNNYVLKGLNFADKKDVINKITNKAVQKKGAYLGFKKKADLVDYLNSEIYGFSTGLKSFDKTPKHEEVKKIIIANINKCQSRLGLKLKMNIHVFPSYNEFINKQMSGVSGYTPDSKNILIFVSNQKGWKVALRNTIIHELSHAISFAYNKWETLSDSLVFEGLAENFREAIVGGKPAPWSIALNLKQSKYYFNKIRKFLKSKDDFLYSEIFLGGSKKYPLWTGYSIGYQIVKNYLKCHKDESWDDVFRMKSGSILYESKY